MESNFPLLKDWQNSKYKSIYYIQHGDERGIKTHLKGESESAVCPAIDKLIHYTKMCRMLQEESQSLAVVNGEAH